MTNRGEQKDVFCEIEFLKEYNQNMPKCIDPDNDTITRWIDTYKFISRSNLHFNISLRDFNMLRKKDEYEYLARLWKKSTNGLCGLECDWDGLVQFQDTELPNEKRYSSVYLLSKEHCDQMKIIAKAYGIIVLDIGSLLNQKMWFEVQQETIRKTKKTERINWKHLEKSRHKCNSIAIVDGYLMKSEELIVNNLIPLLNVFLPSFLEDSLPFNISLITNCDKESDDEQAKEELMIKYDLIDSKLKEIRPHLKYTMGLFNMKGLFHDRHLLTNYAYVKSGAGFGLIVTDSKTGNPRFVNRTTVDTIFPFAVSDFSNAAYEYYSLCQDIKKILLNEKGFIGVGERHNRLFCQFD